jgi:putative membrane protein
MTVETYAARDALGLFEREVLAALDRAAMAAVGRAARDTALGTAASPLALLDAVLVVARSLRMIREIAAIYGFRPGGLAALGLLRRVIVQAVGVAGADLAGEVTAEMLGGLGHKVAGTVSTRLGVGLFAGTRVARLGLATLRACRPMPFLAEPPQLAQILRRALSGS